jgi:hypothetical protein
MSLEHHPRAVPPFESKFPTPPIASLTWMLPHSVPLPHPPHVENVPPPLRTPPSSPPHPSVGSPVFGSPAFPVSVRRAQSHGDVIERPRFFDHSSLSSSESRSFALSREASLREATGTPPLRTPPPSPPFSDTSTEPESIGLSLSIDSLVSGSPPPGNRIERLIDSQVRPSDNRPGTEVQIWRKALSCPSRRPSSRETFPCHASRPGHQLLSFRLIHVRCTRPQDAPTMLSRSGTTHLSPDH